MSEENKTVELKEVEELEKVSGGKIYGKPQSCSDVYLNPEDGCNICSSCGACSWYFDHRCIFGRG